jgi:hypothetical protein
MQLLSQIQHYAFKYYGVDWVIALTVFAGIFLLGDKKKLGFMLGMISSIFGVIFSFQIGSIANGLTSVFLFILYLRGYVKWKE